MRSCKDALFLKNKIASKTADAISCKTYKEWHYIKLHLPSPKKRGRRRSVNMREIFNAMLYVLRSACSWRMLPHDFPAWQTVYACFRRWKKKGIFAQLNLDFRRLVRIVNKKDEEPSANWLSRAELPI